MITLVTKGSAALSYRPVYRPAPEKPDLRRRRRQRVSGAAWLRAPGFSARARLRDMHADGACVESDAPAEPGSAVLVRCYLDGAHAPLSAWARVIRTERDGESYRIGLSFENLGRGVKKSLAGFLERLGGSPDASEGTEQAKSGFEKWMMQYGL